MMMMMMMMYIQNMTQHALCTRVLERKVLLQQCLHTSTQTCVATKLTRNNTHGMLCDLAGKNIKNTRRYENTALLQIGEKIG